MDCELTNQIFFELLLDSKWRSMLLVGRSMKICSNISILSWRFVSAHKAVRRAGRYSGEVFGLVPSTVIIGQEVMTNHNPEETTVSR